MQKIKPSSLKTLEKVLPLLVKKLDNELQNVFQWWKPDTSTGQRAHTHPGPPITGTYWPEVDHRVWIEMFDTRGAVPPFGKVMTRPMGSGKVMIWPAW